MRQSIKNQIEKLGCETKLRIYDTIEALDNGKGSSIEFYSDGSGMSVTYYSPNVNNGAGGYIERNFRINEALLILAGHRLKSSEIPICF